MAVSTIAASDREASFAPLGRVRTRQVTVTAEAVVTLEVSTRTVTNVQVTPRDAATPQPSIDSTTTPFRVVLTFAAPITDQLDVLTVGY
jgi:hypothetical protein